MVWTLQSVSPQFFSASISLNSCTDPRRLAPTYEQLGELYTSNPDFASKVTVAKVDATLNDVPDEIAGFPTIKLYPAGGKDSPIDYTGARTLEDLAAFIRDNGKHGVDGLAGTEEVDEMEDVSSESSDTLAKAAPAATAGEEEASGVAESVMSVVSEAADAAKTFVADTDDGGVHEHDEL